MITVGKDAQNSVVGSLSLQEQGAHFYSQPERISKSVVVLAVPFPLSTLCLTKEWPGMRRMQGNPCPCLWCSMPTAARQEGGRGISAKLRSSGPGKSLSVLNPLHQAGCAQNMRRTVMAAPAWPPLAGRPSPGCATSGVVSSMACC